MSEETPQPPDLARAMEDVADVIIGADEGEEMHGAVLWMWLPDGTSHIGGLYTGGGEETALAARAFIVLRQPALAVLAVEGWSANLAPRAQENEPAIREWQQRRDAGEQVSVTDLPPDCRYETLTLCGETAAGEKEDRLYRIHPAGAPPPAPRRYERLSYTALNSVLRPLFLERPARALNLPVDELRRSAADWVAEHYRVEEVE